MKPTTIVLFAAAVSVLGTWAKGQKLTEKQIVGSIVVLIFLSIMADTVPKVAAPFSWLLLASVVGSYGDELFSKVGTLMGAPSTPVANNNKTGNATGGGGTAMSAA